jgi:hypothetical protein
VHESRALSMPQIFRVAEPGFLKIRTLTSQRTRG